jgi:hypothetical protein
VARAIKRAIGKRNSNRAKHGMGTRTFMCDREEFESGRGESNSRSQLGKSRQAEPVDDYGRLWKVSEPVDDNGRPRTNPDVP